MTNMGQSHGNVTADRFVLIRIEGMHCHKCEQSIKKTLQRMPGVHEVEVDFASGAVVNVTQGKKLQAATLPKKLLDLLDAGGVYPLLERQGIIAPVEK